MPDIPAYVCPFVLAAGAGWLLVGGRVRGDPG